MSSVDTLHLIGTVVAEKYAIESVVGEGGFAVVYRATHLIWKRPVALKVFKALAEVAAGDREKLMQDFIQEGALLAELSEKSASICQARDVGMLTTPRGEGIPYMVLEWLEGASLEHVLGAEQEQQLPPRTLEETVRLIEPAAEALALAHKRGIAHRDIKPANIFLLGSPRGEHCPVKLLDFGIAKVVQDAQKMAGAFTKTSGQVTSFTPAYGAPEQFSRSHGSTGPWTDVFALALVLVECLTGRAPLDGDDFMQIAYCSADKTRRPTPRTLGVAVSDEVEAVFTQALAVSPSERFRSASKFWSALRAAMGLEPLRSLGTPSQPRLSVPMSMSGPHSGTPASPRQAGVPSARPSGLTPGRAPASLPSGEAATALASTRVDPLVPGSTQPVPSSPTLSTTSNPSTTSTTQPAARTSRAPLFAAGGALMLLGAAAAYFGLRPAAVAPSTTGSAVVASAAPSSAPSATAVAPKKNCPRGMNYIEGGQFFMGSNEDLPMEKPAHRVTVAPFCMDVFEVTTAQYKACSDEGHCLKASKTNEWDGIADHERKVYDPLCNIREPEARGKHPINCVDWQMADGYCQEMKGRLPTEAEWEFAARGKDGRKYPWGDDEPTGGHLNACGRECVAWGKKMHIQVEPMYPTDDGWANTAPVGTFPAGASVHGIQDVVGNVWEWVADWYAPYTSDAQDNPTGPAEGTERVIRGGAWNGSQPAWVRPTFRYKDEPVKRSHGIGFRCAATPS